MRTPFGPQWSDPPVGRPTRAVDPGPDRKPQIPVCTLILCPECKAIVDVRLLPEPEPEGRRIYECPRGHMLVDGTPHTGDSE